MGIMGRVRMGFETDEEAALSEDLPSTCLSHARYDEDSRILDVTFRDSGRTYRYYEVPRGKAIYLMQRAPSIGRYYNSGIKAQFQRRRLAR